MAEAFVAHDLLVPRMEELQKPIRGHIVELDSLRGIAAVFVLFDHFRRLWHEAPSPGLSVHLMKVPFVANGKAAVMMFFALSGFVLTLPFLKGKAQSYPIYAIRRVCRIYIPYAVAISLAIFACWKFSGLAMYGNEFHVMWREPPTLSLVAQHLLMLGKFDTFAYNPPIWSLVHEMRISLIFPLLCLINVRLRGWLAFLVACSFPVAASALQNFSGNHSGEFTGADAVGWLKTLGYCGTFLLGSILARHYESISERLQKIPRMLYWPFLVLAILLYQYSGRIPTSVHLQNFATGIGSTYIILMAIQQRSVFSRFLQMKPLMFLGRISYSLYLVHLPILMILSIAIYGRLSYGYLFLPFFAVALIAATLFNRLIEVPSISLGKLLRRS